MQPVSTKEIGTGMFVIGNTKVRPRVASANGQPVSFKRNQKVYFWMQVYNLGVDDKTHKPSATVRIQRDQCGHEQSGDSHRGIYRPDGQCWRPSDPGKTSLGLQS